MAPSSRTGRSGRIRCGDRGHWRRRGRDSGRAGRGLPGVVGSAGGVGTWTLAVGLATATVGLAPVLPFRRAAQRVWFTAGTPDEPVSAVRTTVAEESPGELKRGGTGQQ